MEKHYNELSDEEMQMVSHRPMVRADLSQSFVYNALHAPANDSAADRLEEWSNRNETRLRLQQIAVGLRLEDIKNW